MSTNRFRKGFWMSRNPVALEETPAPTPLPKLELVHHPVITPCMPTAYRVLRRTRRATGLEHDCIGEFRTVTDAMLWATKEKGNALVTDWHGIRFYDNGRPIEERA